MQKILIIGSSSMVGSRVAELLAPHFSLEFADKNIEEGTENSFTLDITNENNVQDVIGKSQADVIIHFAAYTDVDKAEEDRGNEDGLVWKINVLGTQYLVHAAKEHNKKVIYISTDYVFKGDAGPYVEDDAPISGPDEGSWYGWSKRKGEIIIQEVLGEDAIIVRLAYPFRTNYELKPDFVRKMLKRFEENSLYPMFTDQFISPVFVDDIAQGLRAIIEKNERGIWHVVGSTILSPHRAAQLIAETFGYNADAIKAGSLEDYLKEHEEARLRYPINSALINDKVNTLLSQYNAKMHTFEESVKTMKEQL